VIAETAVIDADRLHQPR